MMGLFMSPQAAAKSGIHELLELLASGAPADVFETFLDDARRSGVSSSALTELESAVWRASRVHVQIRRGREREADLTALIDAARELAVPYDTVVGLLHAIARRARLLLSMDMAYVALPDDEPGSVRVHAADGHISDLSAGLRLPANNGIATMNEANVAPFATHDLLADERITLSPAFEEMIRVEGLQAMMAVPLNHGDPHGSRPGGMLYVASRKIRHFTADERSLISSLGILASRYLETTRLRLDAQTRAAELESRLSRVHDSFEGVREYSDLQTELVDVLLSNRDLHALASVAAGALKGGVTVYNAGGDVLTAVGDPADGDDTAILAAVPDVPTEEPSMAEDGVWVAPLCTGKDYLGAVVLRVPDGITVTGRRLLRLFAQMAVLFIRRDTLVTDLDGHTRDNLLNDLLGDLHGPPSKFAERARQLGMNLSKSHLMVVARPENDLHCRANVWASAYARRMGGLRGFREGCVVLLLPGSDAGTVARGISSSMASVLGKPVSVGAAGPLTGADSVQAGYAEAVRCLDAVIALGVNGGAATARELGFVGVLLSNNYDVAGFIEQAVGPVISYDRKHYTDLLPTLQAYFDEGGSPTYAAERLHVHTNTVTRRLDRVKELLGREWQKPARALDIQLALRLLRVRESLSNQPPSAARSDLSA